MLSDKDARKRVALFMTALGNMSNEDAAKFLKNEEE
jgi:predicted CopG family antitoxin